MEKIANNLSCDLSNPEKQCSRDNLQTGLIERVGCACYRILEPERNLASIQYLD